MINGGSKIKSFLQYYKHGQRPNMLSYVSNESKKMNRGAINAAEEPLQYSPLKALRLSCGNANTTGRFGVKRQIPQTHKEDSGFRRTPPPSPRLTAKNRDNIHVRRLGLAKPACHVLW